MSAPVSTAHEAGQAAVDVGHIFGQGGTDGLILYALVLGTFLMFLVAATIAVLSYRMMATKTRLSNEAFARKDELNAEQTRLFIEQMDRTAAASTALAVSVAADLQERAAQTAVLVRLEGTDADLRALLQQLNRVP